MTAMGLQGLSQIGPEQPRAATEPKSLGGIGAPQLFIKANEDRIGRILSSSTFSTAPRINL